MKELAIQDVCRHEHKCACNEWMYATVPNYSTFVNAIRWLSDERKYTLVVTESVRDGDKHTGAFTFKFLCEQEYMWFKLRWL